MTLLAAKGYPSAYQGNGKSLPTITVPLRALECVFFWDVRDQGSETRHYTSIQLQPDISVPSFKTQEVAAVA